ncbi:MAG: hypothetical protein JWQ55_2 [Rhodopila sp.]|nr:hypothetical protein [Rhodopila sp.]
MNHAGVALWRPARAGDADRRHEELAPGDPVRTMSPSYRPAGHLADQYGQKTRIGRVIDRLRCSGFHGGELCQSRPCMVALIEVSGQGKSLRKIREITALGRRG